MLDRQGLAASQKTLSSRPSPIFAMLAKGWLQRKRDRHIA
jgi:hypothetical protein